MNKTSKAKLKNTLVFLLFAICLVLLVYKQKTLQISLQNSLNLCFTSIIPAIFPFMILSDFLMCNLSYYKISSKENLFEKTFHINRSGLIPFLVGNVCGFPLGAKLTLQLLKDDNISEKESRLLIPLSSNPSFAFVVSGVGAGMRGAILDGIVLYISLFLATILSGFLWREQKSAPKFNCIFKKKSFSLANSIKNSALTSMVASSYIIFFSLFLDIIKSFKVPSTILILISAFTEIGNSSYIISNASLPPSISLALTAFSLGISGLSVYMQVKSFANNINIKEYAKIKLTEGVFAFLITYLLSHVLYH